MNLTKYKWKLRILLVSTPSRDNNEYKRTKKLYKKHLKRFHKRYVKMITKKSSNFTIRLIGFDGKTKHKYTKMDVSQIINDIKDMPMGDMVNPTNLSLYSDYNSDTSMDGLGYKNKEKALYTIKAIKKKPIKYQLSVITTMLGRAQNHPNITKDMKEAISIFKKWLKDYHNNN